MTIIQLDERLSNMIAAGEVVENMASVVKELVENSLDAGARSVDITLKDYGLRSIAVSDDGDGMDEDDVKMAFKRHATSKIRTHHDLHHIASLGFRGEALPSIASVSRVTVDTSVSDAPGHTLILEAGDIIDKKRGTAKKGTRITVEKLFYNTPARLKHLKSEKRELSAVVDFVNALALARTDVAFTLVHDGKTLLKSDGREDSLKVLSAIYPLDVIKDMLFFEGENRYYKVKGYCAKPQHARASRRHVTLIANGRPIQSHNLKNAVMEAYRSYLPVHRFPIALLKVEVDPLFIDVNIHPQKLTVKFTEERMLTTLIEESVAARLKKENLTQKVAPSESEKKKTGSQAQFSFTPSHPSTTSPDAFPDPSPGEEDADVKTRRTLPYFEYVGQFFGTYLVFQGEETLYLLDQHAAAERIRYERYLNRMAEDASSRPALTPHSVSLSNKEMTAFPDVSKRLEAFGLKVEPADATTLAVHAVPGWFPEGEEEAFTDAMIRLLLSGKAPSIKKMIDHIAAELACKHSIRANRHLARHEIDKLVRDLDACENPYTCPHGRPTLLSLSEREIETMFKRVQT